ncbi:TPM domain-containing protein [Hymenobacter caeli]|uniref:Membrane protein YgcG n=1 Tax=Hymenobacter caeli TaxID=2735894 RepID=A0ABX2FQQ4_9BACT|nr:TPM domain-containing protein [Hymenobacter caeli]NRT18755.1 putative membrane protein YgcG [Hymenobacter caeli]
MYRFVVACLLLLAGLRAPAGAAPANGLPPRPKPFRFVNDQAGLLAPADAKKLEGGLRRYADNTGTQVVVVTMPDLGGRDVAEYSRALGNAWGVGQRGKNNGIVVLIGAKERIVAIQPGSGLRGIVTPAVTSRILSEQMRPNFKQGNYFAGLRLGLDKLMATANPGSAQGKPALGAAAAPAGAGAGAGSLANASPNDNATPLDNATTTPPPLTGMRPLSDVPPEEPSSPGIGTGVLLVGALVMGGLLYLIIRVFRRKAADNAAAGPQASNNPAFYPNQPGGPPNFLPNSPQAGNYGPGPANYGGQAPNQGGGMGMGGILATGAAAAAGAYIGNRMASGHETGDARNLDTNNAGLGTGAAAGAAGTGAASDYFASRSAGSDQTTPDYFSDNDAAGGDTSGDYFSSDDNSSYDDTSSDDTGGGGFDSTDDNSASW